MIMSLAKDTDAMVALNTANAPEGSRIVALIPAYNEERFIGSVVLKAQKYADVVIVVDDGSLDDTANVASAAGAIVVRHEYNRGKGAALNTGFCYARSMCPRAVVTLDADGQHVVEEMALVTAPILEERADIVVGSRYLEKTSDVPLHRIWGHVAFNFVTNRVSGIPVTDSQSGFRAFSPRAIAAISFQSGGFSVESEMQLLARDHGLRMSEVPITIRYPNPPKRSVVTHGLMVLSGILRLIGQYRPLLFFGVPGMLLLLVDLSLGLWIIEMYRHSQTLALGYTIFCALLALLGTLMLFTGIILHSLRGLLIDLVRPQG